MTKESRESALDSDYKFDTYREGRDIPRAVAEKSGDGRKKAHRARMPFTLPFTLQGKSVFTTRSEISAKKGGGDPSFSFKCAGYFEKGQFGCSD